MSYSVAIGDLDTNVSYNWSKQFRFHLLNGLTGAAGAKLLANVLNDLTWRDKLAPIPEFHLLMGEICTLIVAGRAHPRNKWRASL